MLIQELRKSGDDVTLYAHEDSQAGCKLVGYRESDPYGIRDMLAINRLTSQIAFEHFDIVHTFGRMNNIALLMLSRVPKIVSYQLPPTVSQVKKAITIARKNTLRFTACSNYIARQISPVGKVTTIYNGVEMSDYQFNPDIAEKAPLAFLGRIQQEKGTAIAIQIAKKTNKSLIIAGNVPNEAIHQQYFEEQVKPHIDGEQIKYIGAVNDGQKNELLRNSQAFLMPVTWDEPFGIVMAEALACGTPVIGFRRGAIPEVVTDGLNGFVCDTETDMIAAVANIGSINRSDCRMVAEQRFSAEVLVRQYRELYQLAIGN